MKLARQFVMFFAKIEFIYTCAININIYTLNTITMAIDKKVESKYNLRNKKRDVEKQKKRRNLPDDDDDDSEDDEDYETEDEEELQIDNKEYTKFLSKLFPSKYLDDKTKKKKSKKVESEEDNDEETEKIHIICTIDDKGRSSYDEYDDSSYDEGETSYDEYSESGSSENDEDDEDDEDDDDEDDDDEDDEDEDEDDEDADDEQLDEDNDADEESNDDNDNDQYDEEDRKHRTKPSVDKNKLKKRSDKNKSSDKKKSKINKSTNLTNTGKPKQTESEQDVIKSFNKLTEEFSKKHKKSKAIKEIIKTAKQKETEYKKKEDKKSKKERVKNVKKFKKIVRENNSLNDYKFFEKMNVKDQKMILKELRKVCKVIKVEKPYRLKLLESDIPLPFKSCALRKINTLRHMDPMAGDYYKLQHWVDAFMRIPFNKYCNLPISHSDGQDKCHDFMEKAVTSLNTAVYGMNDAKMQIIQMLGQWVTNPNAIGTAIAIKGPPGTGKTTLVKEGISKLLNREFAFIALGGATDSSFLEGHSYTYEGSTWGKIVDILIQKQSMNPVIYFDELDKISDTPKGEEIVGILTHLTDTSQNDKFHDKYFSEIDFDLSKCLFIFSYNDESKINPVLIDRMYRIQTNGYNCKEKIHIVRDYLLPKISKDVQINQDITFSDEIISYIIETYTGQEKGVRNLKRCIEVIYRKLNLFQLMRPGTKLFDDNSSLLVEFPLTITRDLVDKMVKKQDEDNHFHHSFYL